MGAAHGPLEHSGDPVLPSDIHFHMEIRGPGLTHAHAQKDTERTTESRTKWGCAGKFRGPIQ